MITNKTNTLGIINGDAHMSVAGNTCKVTYDGGELTYAAPPGQVGVNITPLYYLVENASV